jgi:hypothetical protein
MEFLKAIKYRCRARRLAAQAVSGASPDELAQISIRRRREKGLDKRGHALYNAHCPSREGAKNEDD